MEYVTLNNGVKMPILGFGVYQIENLKECEQAVSEAIQTGYRLIDTAQAYFNEEAVGNAVKKSGLPRQDFFLVTKVWISNAGYEKAKASIEESLRKLQTDYIDLLLIHQPFNDYYGTYRAMEEAYKDGKIRAVGVSNFYPENPYGKRDCSGDDWNRIWKRSGRIIVFLEEVVMIWRRKNNNSHMKIMSGRKHRCIICR